jgi:tripartite-type tricarboxylate transporter receptor subunit TctC
MTGRSTFRLLGRRRVLATGALGAPLILASGARAQTDYPTAPIRLVLGFPPGGATDVMGRLLGVRLSEVLGQQVVIENRSGAAGNIASEFVAKARPDGYTLLLGTSIMSIVPALYETLPYDPLKSFESIALVSLVPVILFTSMEGPTSVEALVAKLRADSGKSTYPSPGNGSLMHLTAHLFAKRAGAEAVHVPYRGSGPAIQDMLAARHTFQFETLGATKSFFEAGRLRLLALAADERSPLMPDVPTIKERAGFSLESRTWNVVFAPAGTPRPIVERLNAAINKALAHPDLIETASKLAITIVGNSTPESAMRYYRDQIAYWDPIARASGAKIE